MKFALFIGWLGLFFFFLFPLFISLLTRSRPRKNSLEKGSDMVLDQICGVYIPKDNAERLKSKGKVYYFCSKKCQDKFIAGIE